MKKILILILFAFSYSLYGQSYSTGEFNDLIVKRKAKIGSFYIFQNSDSLWIEKPLGTYLVRLDTLSALLARKTEIQELTDSINNLAFDTLKSEGDTLYLLNKSNNNLTKVVIRNGYLQLPTIQGLSGELNVSNSLVATDFWLNAAHTYGFAQDAGSLLLFSPDVNSGAPTPFSSFLMFPDTVTKIATKTNLSLKLNITDTSALARKTVVNDSIARLREDIGSGGGSSFSLKPGPFLDSQGDSTHVPYSSKASRPGVGAWFYEYNSVFDRNALQNDTSIIISTINYPAITGYGFNSQGLFGHSYNNYGVSGNGKLGGLFGSSLNGNGVTGFSTYGNLAKFINNSNDSLVVKNDASLHQFHNGVEVLSTDTSGNIIQNGDTLNTNKFLKQISMPVSYAIPFTHINTQILEYTVSANTTFTPDTAGALSGSSVALDLIGTGDTATFEGFVNTADTSIHYYKLTDGRVYTFLLGKIGKYTYPFSLINDIVLPGAVTLSAPGSFTATAISTDSIVLSWSTVANASYYELDSAHTSGGTWATLSSTIPQSQTGDTVVIANPNQTVYFRLRSIGNGTTYLTSTYTTANATTDALAQLSTPTLNAIALNSDSIRFYWSNITNNVGYKLAISSDNGSTWPDTINISQDVTADTIMGLNPGTRRDGKLQAQADLINYNHSNWSAVALDTTTGNQPPSFTSVTLSGNANLDSTLTATANGYADNESDAQGTTLWQWERSDNGTTGWADISGATTDTLVLVSADSAKYVRAGATPVATTGTSPGTEVFSSASAQVTRTAGLPTEGLVAYYKMASLLDETANNNDGTINGTVTLTTGRKSDANEAYDFDGTSGYISVADAASLDFTTSFSVSCWINIDAVASNNTVLAKWDYATQGGFAIQTFSTSDEIQVYIASSLTDAGTNSIASTNFDLTSGSYVHLVVVYDGSQAVNQDRVKIYKNSSLRATGVAGTIATSLPNNSATLKIGNFGGTLNRYFDGKIDDVRIYNRVLTQSEINALYAE